VFWQNQTYTYIVCNVRPRSILVFLLNLIRAPHRSYQLLYRLWQGIYPCRCGKVRHVRLQRPKWGARPTRSMYLH